MRLLIGTWDSAWGHTWAVRGNGKVYALRSLAEGSSLCVFDAGTMRLLKEFPEPGAHPCHITLLLDQAILADYTSGTLSVFPLDPDGMPCGEAGNYSFGGKLPHIHSSWVTPDGGHLIVADLGTDAILKFSLTGGKIDIGSCTRFEMPAGSGPRHCTFIGDRLYVSTERSDEILVLGWPSMALLQRCLVNEERPGGGAHILQSPDRRFIYASSRLANDGIATFAVGADGLLEKVAYTPTGRHPRHFCLTPDGESLLVACRDDDVVQFFDRKPDGSLSFSGQEIEIEKPVYVEVYEED